MRDDWKVQSLREAGVALIDCDHRTPPASSNGIGYPYVTIPQLKQGRLDLSDVRRISREHFVEWTRKAKPQPDDVILSRRCNPGETAVVPEGLECALGQNLVLLRADETKMFPPFLRWLVRGRDWWEQIGKFLNVGAVFDSLRCADIPNFQLPVPPLAEQQAIAQMLGALDDKIELNLRINETLEALAQSFFKSWFVDATRNGLPQSWRDARLDELAAISGGKQLPTNECKPSGRFPVFGANGVMGFADRVTHEDFVIAFGRVGAYCGSIHWAYGGAWINNNASSVVPHRWPEFVLQAMLNVDFEAIRTGSAQPFIPNSALAAVEVVRPPDSVLDSYCSVVLSLRRKQNLLEHESRTLAVLRDALLPKLLSGEVRVGSSG